MVCQKLTPLVTIGHDPTHPLQAQGQTLLNRQWGFHTITAIAIPHTETQEDPSIPTHPETEQHLFEVSTPIFAMPVGRPRRLRRLRFVLIGPLEGNRGGILLEPGRRESIDFQGFERDRTKHRVEIGRKQRVEDMPQAVIIEGGSR
jgi:hypothetical protein